MSDNSVVSSDHLNTHFFTCRKLPHWWESVRGPRELMELGILLLGFAAVLCEIMGQCLEAPVPTKYCKPDL